MNVRPYRDADLEQVMKGFFESQGFRLLRPDVIDCRGVKIKRYAMDKLISPVP